MQSYCSIIDYIPYPLYYIPVTYLFYNCKFVPINPLNLFFPTPNLLLSGNYSFMLCIYVFVSVFVCEFVFRFYI